MASTSTTEPIHVRNATDDADLWETCLVCNEMTNADPREIYVRDPTHGRVEAKAHICDACLTDRQRSWRHNKHR